jgi:hypothetical protein
MSAKSNPLKLLSATTSGAPDDAFNATAHAVSVRFRPSFSSVIVPRTRSLARNATAQIPSPGRPPRSPAPCP